MIKSVLPKTKKIIFFLSIILIAAISYCFNVADMDWLTWGNKCLTQAYDPSADVKLKKWELNLTDDSFIRLRKTYQNGKQEYFSFQLHQLDNVDYLGNENAGILKL